MNEHPAPSETAPRTLAGRGLGHLAAALGVISALACSGDVNRVEPLDGALTESGLSGEVSIESSRQEASGAGGAVDSASSDRPSPEGSGDAGGSGGAGAVDAAGSRGESGAGGTTGAGASTDTGAGGTVGDSGPDRSLDAGDGAPPDVSVDAPRDVVVEGQGPPRDSTPDTLADASDGGSDITDTGSPVDQVDSGPAGGYVTVVAHPDDDILFFNPDMEGFIRQGSSSTTVYVTSGDGSEGGDWPRRERGILNAQSSMAGVNEGDWACQLTTFVGHSVQRCVLSAVPRVATIFLRLPDGSIENLLGPPLLQAPAVSSLSPIADSGIVTAYTYDDLIAVLAEIMRQSSAGHINTMDSTLAYGPGFWDHRDHISVGFFALMAAQAYGHVDGVRIYRGYTTQFDPNTLTTAQTNRKAALMQAYGADCNGDYAAWCARQISYGSLVGAGQLRQPLASCLESQGTVGLATCSGSATQTWTVGSNATIQVGSGCLATSGSSLVVGNCDGSVAQRWTWFDNGQLRSSSGACLSASGASVLVDACSGDGSQADGGSVGPANRQIWTH